MSSKPSLEERIDQLEERVEGLNDRVRQLSTLLRQVGAPLPPETETHVTQTEPEDSSEELLTWVGQSSLLPRMATLCFLLVVALVLRTVTDSQIVDQQVGSLLGMTYSGVLLFAGWQLYRRQHSLAAIFSVCGAALMYTIVVETHSHFESLPTVPAYVLLMATGTAMAAISYLNRVALPVIVGTLGLCLAGVAVDYPNPFYPYLALVLLYANILGTFATRMKRCTWLRWILLIVTLLMLQAWGIRLGVALARGEAIPAELAAGWYLPVVAVFFATFLTIAVLGILVRGTERVSRFDFSLPTINALWAFSAAQYAVSGRSMALGLAGLTAAALHMAAAAWLGRRHLEGAPGTNAFAVAGAALLALALPISLGSTLLALPLLSALAFGLALAARNWGSGGARFTSYLLQIYTVIALAQSELEVEKLPSPLLAITVAALVAALSFFHYRWCRNNAPPEGSLFFGRFDQENRLATLLLLGSLAAGFFLARTGIHLALLQTPEATPDTFAAFQSVLINASAAGLMIFAFARRNKEIRNVAVLVTIIGGCKVFIFDLMRVQGFPLILSVFSFGVVIALESVALSRWQRIEAWEARKSTEQDQS